MAIKEIQLSNIPKSELGEIMVRAVQNSQLACINLPSQSEIDLLKNLNVRLTRDYLRPPLSITFTAPEYRQVQGVCEDS